jgi:STE24 endopeptidase
MNIYLFIILVILFGDYLLTLLVENMNVRYASPDLPAEFRGFYDAEKYRKSQEYLRENTRFDLFTGTVTTALLIMFILAGGFDFIDCFARSFQGGTILTGLIFAGVIAVLAEIVKIPFSVYHTFVIEEKYGFNRTTPKTFILDLLKGWLIGAFIAGTVFAGIIWFFGRFGPTAWVFSWIAITLFQVFLLFVAPVVIMPLFNKFKPLETGELRTAIEDYARARGFKMKGVFSMDGSRRSTKSNAFFTGFGRFRRIVLFDTLIARHTVGELVAVLAHEMGHYKKRHILKYIIMSVLSTGLMLFILSRFINNPGLFTAFRMEHLSVYASLIFFAFLYAPIAMLISVFTNILSRKHEYGADSYAVATRGDADDMINALKKLSVDNLSNLTPHPLKVFLQYSHPPVLERIRVLRALAAGRTVG